MAITVKPKDETAQDRLIELVEQAGMTRYGLAQDTGLSVNTIYRGGGSQASWAGWSVDTLNRISIALGKQLGKRPTEVYSILTGLPDTIQ